ncbi:MAG: hypothetical protein ACIAQF_00470 [Phycisphaerales bacterium JB065]
MGSTRSILLVKVLESEDPEGEAAGSAALRTVSLGRLEEVQKLLLQFNCSGDGSPSGSNVIYGPGVVLQMPMVDRDDPVNQILVSLSEDSVAWPVLTRICRVLGWKMMDPSSGRTFG